MLLPSFTQLLLLGLTTVHALPQVDGTQLQPASAQTAPLPQASSTALANPSSSSSSTAPSSGTACNNSPDLCSRAYNDVTYLGAHNSAFLRDASTDFTISGNHFFNATLALDAGLRLLQAQVHDKDGVLHLCHSSCSLLDAGPLVDWLSKIETWIANNERDVVTILLVNAADATAADFASAWQSSGLAAHGYAPPSTQSPLATWPTLGEMISSGKRLVSFITQIDASPAAPYLLPEFSYVFETHFEVTALTGFNCSIDRPSRAGDDGASALAAGWLGLINHFKYQNVLGSINFPDVNSIETVNDPGSSAVGNLGRQLNECATAWGGQGNKKPNFVLIDFWSENDPLKAVDAMNKVTSAEGRSRANVKELGPEGAKGRASAGRTSVDLGHAALLAFVSWAVFLI
ncbi:hypothetical protein NLU13_2329 [Sarocladium strictum]|uniref:PLC-like phosphodiesterase n=1 Tax=Sarocladium strictum TaxID=5046 RepID=A0AA39GSM3_SARSR|nr:hypothetical protein NLU13_2329 [Sarocladium strictum]